MDDINTMMYEAFMAEYGLFPDEADERFSLRQMTLILEARNRRKKNESKVLAYKVLSMAFGEQEQKVEMVTHQPKPKSLSFFGISRKKGG